MHIGLIFMIESYLYNIYHICLYTYICPTYDTYGIYDYVIYDYMIQSPLGAS